MGLGRCIENSGDRFVGRLLSARLSEPRRCSTMAFRRYCSHRHGEHHERDVWSCILQKRGFHRQGHDPPGPGSLLVPSSRSASASDDSTAKPSRLSRNGPGRSTPRGCSGTATTTCPGGCGPRATWRLTKFDLSKRLDSGQTDIPRLREGGVKAQFWSVYIPSEHPNPARTVTEQIDLVHRMIEQVSRRPRAGAARPTTSSGSSRSGKIASLIGIEGGVAIENSLAQLRAFHHLGARYMTLTHNTTLDWADAATDAPKHDGLTPFGERVVKEMNRLGMLVDISHVSPDTMADALRVSQAPVIASHSSAFAICPSPRNVPDDILQAVKKNGGVVMVNFYSGFIVPEAGQEDAGDAARSTASQVSRPGRRTPRRWRPGSKPTAQARRGGRSTTSPTTSTISSRSPASTTSASAPTSTASPPGPSASRTSRGFPA